MWHWQAARPVPKCAHSRSESESSRDDARRGCTIGVLPKESRSRRGESLPASEERDRRALAFELLNDGVLITDLDGRITSYNAGAERMYGYSKSEMLGHTVDVWMVRPEVGDQILEAIQRDGQWRGQIEFRRKDGSLGVSDTIVVPLHDEDGRRIGALGVNTDVTEKVRAQHELETALSLMRATIESTPDGILVVDAEGRIAGYNRKFVEMWGIPADVLERHDDRTAIEFVLAHLVHPERFVERVEALYKDPLAASFDVLEFRDGRVFERYSQPQQLNGQPVGRVWSFRDVTKRVQAERALRQSEEQLRQSQKMEAVGRLAGGIAHDFSNILTVIRSYSELVLRALPTADKRRGDVDAIKQAADRGTSLIRQLLAFGRKQIVQPLVLDANEVVMQLDDMLRRLIGEDIHLETILATDGALVRADPSQLEQIVLNLAVNARDAMPRGGTLSIRTSRVTLSEADVRAMDCESPAGDFVCFAISDTGEGMSPEVMARVFEPFFTTKRPGEGTGLGLATVYAAVRQMGGAVTVNSEPGRGTTFRIHLPVATAAPRTNTPEATPAYAPMRRVHVLVVEDDRAIRALVRDILQAEGLRVSEAANGREALDVLARASEPVALVVSDLVMPQMGGRELAERLSEGTFGDSQHVPRVLFMSGYTDDEILRRQLLQDGTPFLQKPFTPDMLVRKVREALATRSAYDPQHG